MTSPFTSPADAVEDAPGRRGELGRGQRGAGRCGREHCGEEEAYGHGGHSQYGAARGAGTHGATAPSGLVDLDLRLLPERGEVHLLRARPPLAQELVVDGGPHLVGGRRCAGRRAVTLKRWNP